MKPIYLLLILSIVSFAKPQKKAVLFDACEIKMQAVWNQAIHHFDADEYTEAMPLFKKMEKECPKSLSAMNYIALIHRLNGDFELSIATYERMRGIQPKNLKVLADLYDTCVEGAEFDLDKQKWEAMEKKLARAAEIRPETIEIWGLKSQAAILRKDFKACLVLTTKILNKEPQDADAFFDRATCRANLQDMENALLDISQAIRLNPDTEWYLARAHMYATMNRCPEAMKDINYLKKESLDEELDHDYQKVLALCRK